jgi:hypothetical protein
MTSIKNYKGLTAMVAISAIAAVLTGSVHMALGVETVTLNFDKVKSINNTGINVPTDTDQKQDCQTAGTNSGIRDSCTASSSNTVTESGGILKK